MFRRDFGSKPSGSFGRAISGIASAATDGLDQLPPSIILFTVILTLSIRVEACNKTYLFITFLFTYLFILLLSVNNITRVGIG